MAIDPYVHPGTIVLKNLPGIEDHDRLMQFEAVSTADRISELRFKPILGLFDVDHLQRIHWHIFQDVYDWASQFYALCCRNSLGKAAGWKST